LESTPLQRALAVAPERTTAGKARPEQEFFCFRVGNLKLGVPSENVREVVRAGVLTPLPRTPAFILGVTAHRGEVLPVVDLLRFLGKGEARIGTRTRLFVGISGTHVAAVVADSVLGLKRFPVSEILPPPVGGDQGAENLIGVVQASTRGDDAWSLLNFPKLLAAARQRAVAR
jgi:purine-binding chemotaxis protein CheW